MARSVAALVKGYAEFDRDLNLKGLLLNKVGSAAHGTWLKEALAAAAATQQQQQQQQQGGGLGLAGVQVLGCIPQVSCQHCCCCCSCCCCTPPAFTHSTATHSSVAVVMHLHARRDGIQQLLSAYQPQVDMRALHTPTHAS
jgi:hypothetical protein